MRRALRAGVVAPLAAGILAGLALPGPALAGTPADEVLDHLQIPAESRRRLARGEVIVYPVEEGGERELAVGLALLAPAPAARIAEALAAGLLITRDASVSAFGVVGDPAGPSMLPIAGLLADERDEAAALLAAGPGARFNLSPAEIESMRALRTALEGQAGGGVSERVWGEYRRLLAQRARAYERSGLGGIAPYARSGGVTDPAAELRRAAPDADRLARYGQGLHAALLGYPAPQALRPRHRLYWIKRQVQKRPAVSLLHQMVVGDADLLVHVERYYYVEHSYNAAQIITGVAAHPDGALVFATSRFSTDEVLGLGNPLKRAVGRAQLRGEMQKRLERFRDSFRGPPPVPAQSP